MIDTKNAVCNILQPSRQRLVGLDLFRIMSVLVIYFFHTAHIGCDYGILQPFISMGAMFMTAFFMLSGFVLYYTNLEKELLDLSVLKFYYIKRFIGIVPIYWVIAVIYTVYSVAINGENMLDNLVLIPIETLGLQSVFCSVFSISHNGGTWFVSCLLMCYVIFPFLSNTVKQLKMKGKAILGSVLSGILLYSPLVVGILDLDNIYSNPFFRSLEFLIGILICATWIEVKEQEWYRKFLAKYWIILIEFVLLVVCVTVAVKLQIPSVSYMMYSWIGLPLYTLMLLGLPGLEFPGLNNLRVLKYAASISYVFFFAQFFT